MAHTSHKNANKLNVTPFEKSLGFGRVEEDCLYTLSCTSAVRMHAEI